MQTPEELERLENIRFKKRRGDALTDEEYELLTKFWQSRPKTLVPSIAKRQTIPTNHHIPGQLYCTICDKHVPYAQATFGSSTRIRVEEHYTTLPDGTVHVDKKVRAQVNRVVACPDHVLEIKAKVDKDGRVTNQVRFDYI